MKQGLDVFPEFNLSLHDLAKYYFCANDKKAIWHFSEKGILFKLFQKYGGSGDHLSIFFKHVHEVIKRRKNMLMKADNKSTLIGRYLIFDPSATMYDGLAEEVSSGFFDSDDVPPPEFWVGVKGNLLISFIPSDFITSADEGIESSMSGCIEWSGELFSITL